MKHKRKRIKTADAVNTNEHVANSSPVKLQEHSAKIQTENKEINYLNRPHLLFR